MFGLDPVGNEVLLVENDGLLMRQKRQERWAVLNDIYFGKDGDLVNFPLIRYHEDSLKRLRYKIIPEMWFDAMYDKTGVSGKFMCVCSDRHSEVNRL